MKTIFQYMLIIFTLSLVSCITGTNSEGKRGNMWVKQAHKVTSKNIRQRDSKVKQKTKKNEQLSKENQEANDKSSKVKKPKKFSGEFKFY